MDFPAPLPCPPFFLAQEHRTAPLSLPSTSSRPSMAEDAPPATTRAAAPPCTAAVGFPCSLAHATSTAGFARVWGARRSPLPDQRPHHRRALAADDLLCFGSADGWGPADPRARLSAPVCVRACSDPGGSSNFEPGFSEGIKEMIYIFRLNALEIYKLKNIAPTVMKQILLGFL